MRTFFHLVYLLASFLLLPAQAQDEEKFVEPPIQPTDERLIDPSIYQQTFNAPSVAASEATTEAFSISGIQIGPLTLNPDKPFESTVDWENPTGVNWGTIDPGKIDWPKVSYPSIDWGKIDLKKIPWDKVDPSKIDWPKVDTFKVDWPKVDLSKVDWSQIDPAKLDWRQVDLRKIDTSALSKAWKEAAAVMDKLYDTDLRKEFTNATKDWSWEKIQESGTNLLVEKMIDLGREWLDSPQGLKFRDEFIKYNIYYQELVVALRYAKETGIITSESQCLEYTDYVAQAVTAYAEKQSGPVLAAGANMFSRDMGRNACHETLAVEPFTPLNPAWIWRSGVKLPTNHHLVSCKRKNYWRPAAGWIWASPNNFVVKWVPGRSYPGAAHCIAAKEENTWRPQTGYVVDPSNPKPPHVIRRRISGLGAIVSKDRKTGWIRIESVAPTGGASQNNRIRQGWTEIVEVNQVDVTKLTLHEVVEKYFIGKPDTKIYLKMIDPETGDVRAVDVLRRDIDWMMYKMGEESADLLAG